MSVAYRVQAPRQDRWKRPRGEQEADCCAVGPAGSRLQFRERRDLKDWASTPGSGSGHSAKSRCTRLRRRMQRRDEVVAAAVVLQQEERPGHRGDEAAARLRPGFCDQERHRRREEHPELEGHKAQPWAEGQGTADEDHRQEGKDRGREEGSPQAAAKEARPKRRKRSKSWETRGKPGRSTAGRAVPGGLTSWRRSCTCLAPSG